MVFIRIQGIVLKSKLEHLNAFPFLLKLYTYRRIHLLLDLEFTKYPKHLYADVHTKISYKININFTFIIRFLRSICIIICVYMIIAHLKYTSPLHTQFQHVHSEAHSFWQHRSIHLFLDYNILL